tara:strand:+ start:43 stop:174 length:132 start_codon:yes stop_codon:yes gene_type:complete
MDDKIKIIIQDGEVLDIIGLHDDYEVEIIYKKPKKKKGTNNDY